MQSFCSSLCSWLRCSLRCTAWAHVFISTPPSTALTAASVLRLPLFLFVLAFLNCAASGPLVLHVCLCTVFASPFLLFMTLTSVHLSFFDQYAALCKLAVTCLHVSLGNCWQHLWSAVGFLQAWHFLWHQRPACTASAEDLQDHQVSPAGFLTLRHLLRFYIICISLLTKA